MKLRVAVQMDPPEGLNLETDSTFPLMLEAQKRGYSVFHYMPSRLGLWEGRVLARGQDITISRDPEWRWTTGPSRLADLSEMDVIFLRQDPPFNMAYLTTTYLLERLHPKSLVVNNPAEVRNAPEKLFVTDFHDLVPPTLITQEADMIRAFREAHGDIVFKPLYGNGGSGVLRLRSDDGNMSVLLEIFQQIYGDAFVVQKYLPQVREGDKRLMLVDGAYVGGFNRIPGSGEIRSNIRSGGRGEPLACLSDRDQEICSRIGPFLKERGLVFAGIDVIGDFLTEINVTSPTGTRQILHFGGLDIIAAVWDAVEDRLKG